MNFMIVQACMAIFLMSVSFIMISQIDMNTRYWYFVLICIVSGIWIGSNACLNLTPAYEYAHFFYCLSGMCATANAPLTLMLVFELSNIRLKHHHLIVSGMILAAFVFFSFTSSGVEGQFIYSQSGTWFLRENSFFTIFCDAYVILYYLFIIYVLIRWLRESEFRRAKMQAFGVMFCMALGLAGWLYDRLQPQTFLISNLTQFSLVMILLYFAKRYNSLSITVQNFAGYIYNFAGAPVMLLDENNDVCLANNNAADFFGMDSDELSGLNALDLFEFDDMFNLSCIYEFSKEPENYDVKCKLNDRICSVSINRIYDNYNDPICTVLMVSDMTEKLSLIRRLDESKKEAETASSAKSIFLANMSHEIRTPISGILGFTEFALDDRELSAKTRNYIEKVKLSAEGLLGIINDILDVSKIEAGKMELEKIPFSLRDVLHQCETISAVKVAQKDVELYVTCNPDTEGQLLGDPTKLRQALLNLLSNAVKFTESGLIKLTAAIRETDGKALIRFEVHDSGIGMTEEQIRKIFQPFTQADSSTTRKFGGTGLGLTITKNMIELMGGRLEVESTPGLGTRFYFDLAFEILATSVDKPAQEEIKTFEGISILVCEDNELNREVITGHLEKLGIAAEIAENGYAGLEKHKQRQTDGKPFDLILMDIHMPVMDGLASSRKLRESGYAAPIIAMTANAMADDKAEYLKNGFNDCLIKPFVSEQLYKCLVRHLKAGSVPMPDDEPDTWSMAEVSGLIDRALGLKLYADNEDLYKENLSDFLKNGRDLYVNLTNTIDAEEIQLAYRLAHTFKGRVALLGAPKLFQAATNVEYALSKGGRIPDSDYRISGDQALALKTLTWALEDALADVLNELMQTEKEQPCGAAESFSKVSDTPRP